MRKDELVKKKKKATEQINPAESLLTMKPVTVPDRKESKKTEGTENNHLEVQEPEKNRIEINETTDKKNPIESNNIIVTKKGPGKPRKRKPGDRKVSFWLDADLVHGLYSTLVYGESAGEKINEAIREYQKNHGYYMS